MTDRALLELAAKAVGYEVVAWDDRMENIPVVKGDRFGNGKVEKWYWMPNIDDGDALRLAVKLDLLVMPYPLDNAVRVTRLDQPDTVVYFGTPSDPLAATRRAIVRAAAEIGRTMP